MKHEPGAFAMLDILTASPTVGSYKHDPMTIAQIDAHPDRDRIWATVAAMRAVSDTAVEEAVEEAYEEINEAERAAAEKAVAKCEANLSRAIEKALDAATPQNFEKIIADLAECLS